MDVTPGTNVTVKIIRQPNSAAAQKTLVRLLSKDREVVKRDDKLARIRKAGQTKSPRGGRWRVWESRQPKIRTITGTAGESGTFFAGSQEVRDLKSVEKYVEVSAA